MSHLWYIWGWWIGGSYGFTNIRTVEQVEVMEGDRLALVLERGGLETEPWSIGAPSIFPAMADHGGVDSI